jgi:hypothetical protein
MPDRLDLRHSATTRPARLSRRTSLKLLSLAGGAGALAVLGRAAALSLRQNDELRYFLPLILKPPAFVLQPGTPAYLPNFANTSVCAWMGVAGQVFDLSGNPLVGYRVQLLGSGIGAVATTGNKTAYGPGGYEMVVGSAPVATTDVYTVQLLDPNGIPLSFKHSIPTYDNCDQNLIVVNFVPNALSV